MLTASWVEITGFPQGKDFYNGDIVAWSFSPHGNGGGGHAGWRPAHFRPGEMSFYRLTDEDSRNFQNLVLSGRIIPNARFVTQRVDGDTVTSSTAVYVEKLLFKSFRSASRNGQQVDEMEFAYTWVDIAYK